MPKVDQDTKQKRVERVYHLVERHDGLTEQEIADMLNMGRRTVNNYLNELQIQGRVDKEGRLWIALPFRRTRLRHFELSPEEAMTLYLATRLLVKQHDKRNESAEAALVKLAEVLTGDVGVGYEIHQAAQELAQRPGDVSYSRVFRAIMQSYIYRHKVSITYHPMNRDPFQTVFSPYLLEPSAIGYATYVIGHSSIVDDLRTYKLQRIEQATLTGEEYIVPADFPGLDYLRSAWSIISGEDLIDVRLRFSPRVTRRVRESRWHPSQDVTDDPETPGGCIWTAHIADLTDFRPWVRSWGADVEVLAPERLRAEMMGETRRLAALYKMAEVEPPPLYQLLWAKTDKPKTTTHPLICHLIDVAQVTRALWNDVLTDGIRTQIAEALGLDVDAAGRLLAFWAGLHDLGKACPCFQRKHAPTQASLAKAGLSFPKVFSRESCPHGTISADALDTLLETESGLPRRLAKKVARAVGGHHGAWPSPAEVQHIKSTQKGGEDWDAVRRDMLHAMSTLLEPPPVERLGDTLEEKNALLTLFSGLTSTADWIGSMERYFPYAQAPVDPAHYAERAEAQAHRALEELGWIGWRPPAGDVSFRGLFRLEPRPMQEAVMDLAKRLDEPALVIIEAPTGVGKTEAALYLADHWAHRCQQRGLYVAMPTMATSNQMFRRVQEVLARRYPEDLVNVHLIHGQARWSDDMKNLRLETADERQGGTVAAMAWFLPHKRSLLAPFGVGTVDQALLSVLQTRHFFIRLFGLSHKTVIFDEVHAYDTYMSTIFQRLLGWLRAVGTSVVILSATLPAQTRHALLRAYAGTPDTPLLDVSYPAITWAMGGQTGVVPLEAPDSRTVALEWIERQPGDIVARLADELRDGGCAAVICNTVRRTQEVYQALQAAEIVPPDDLTLFHARFPFAWRDEIEQKVLSSFGKTGDRPRKAIVVATQVIEQSLDLDFDLLITDLAPVDLILQRAGRLHRHYRDGRPTSLRAPRLLLTRPLDRAGVPDFDRDVYVYEPFVLLRSYLALEERDRITLPGETEALIEAVYGQEEPPAENLTPALIAALEQAHQRMQRHEEEHVYKARTKLVPGPQSDHLMTQRSLPLEENSPELHKAFQALTRLIPPGVSLVCLHRTAGGLALEPDGSAPMMDLMQQPDPDLTEQLARHTLKVTHQPVFQHFLAQPVPVGWRDHPLLRNYRAVIFTDGVCPLVGTPYTLRLSREIGLEIEKEEE
jgi:CRISPR-associated endonuclease/helicase Cas3